MPLLRRPPDPEGVWCVVQITTVDHEVIDVAVCEAEDTGCAGGRRAPVLRLGDPDVGELRRACTLANPALFADECTAPVSEREIVGTETSFDEPALRWVEEVAHADQRGSLEQYWAAVKAHRTGGGGGGGGVPSWPERASSHGWPVATPACDDERQRYRLVDRRVWDGANGLAASVHCMDGRLRLIVCGEPAAVLPRCEGMHSATAHAEASADSPRAAPTAVATAELPLSGTLSIDESSGFIKLNDAQRDFLQATASAMAEASDEEVLAGTTRIVRSYGQRWLTEPLPGILKAVGTAATGFDAQQVTERQLKEFARDFGRTFGKGVINVVSSDRPREMRTLEELCERGSQGTQQQAMDDEAKRLQLNSVVSSLLQTIGLQLDDDALDACCKRVLYNLTVTPAIDLAISHECPPALYQARFVLLVGGTPLELRVYTATYVGGPVAGDQPQVMHTPFLLRMLTPNLLTSETDEDGAHHVGGELQYTTAFTMDPRTKSLVDKDMDWFSDAVENGAWDGFGACWFDPSVTISSLLDAYPSAHEVALRQKEAWANSVAHGDLSAAGEILRDNFKNLEKGKEGVRAGIKIVQEVTEDAKKIRGEAKLHGKGDAPFGAVESHSARHPSDAIPEGVPPSQDAVLGESPAGSSIAYTGDSCHTSDAPTPLSPHAPVSVSRGLPPAAPKRLDLHGLWFLGHIAVGGQPSFVASRTIEERRVLAEVHASRRRRQMVHDANVLRRQDEKLAQDTARATAKEQLMAIDKGTAKEAALLMLTDDKVVQTVDGAKRVFQESDAARKAQALLKGGAITSISSEGGPTILDASKLMDSGKELLSEVLQKTAVAEADRDSLLDNVRNIKGVAKILDCSQSQLQQIASVAAASGVANPELAKLRKEGKSILSTAKSPAQIMQAMQSQPDFLERVKRACIRFLEDAVAGTEVPPIEGNANWGTWGLYGMTIGKLVIPSDLLDINVGTRVTVTVAKLRLALDPFAYSFEKTQWPRLRDTGAATAAASDLAASITFGVVAGSSEADVPRVDNIVISVKVGEMSVVVDSAKGGGSQRWLYNKLLAVFSERCRATVQGELEQAAQRGIGILSQRVQEAIKAFTTGGGLGGAGLGGAGSTAAKEAGDAGPEPEPEPEVSFEF